MSAKWWLKVATGGMHLGLLLLWTTLIQTYEEQHEAESVPTNTTILQFFMTEHDLTPADLIELGEPSVVQNVLAGKLSLTPPQLHVLARRFDVVPETFISVR